MFSIASTFRETFFLAAKNFWFLVAITVVTQSPAACISVFNPPHPRTRPHAHSDLVYLWYELILVVTALIFEGISRAAILALLRPTPAKNAGWASVLHSIRTYTCTLVRLSLLLGGIAILLAIPVALVIKLVGAIQLLVVILTALYLIFAKYALAAPLIVVENMGARAALQRSWEMTKGHFWYVAGCYLILGASMGLANRLIVLPTKGLEISSPVMVVMVHLCFDVLATLWIILAWVMYLRIKTEEDQISEVNQALSADTSPDST